MKKLILFISIALVSCGPANLSDAVVVEQINVLSDNRHKYEVKLKTDDGSANALYYTNFRFQVGDTLVSYYEFFEGKDQELKILSKENDSLKKELKLSNYYLELLKEKLIIDSTKK